jgi:hypothetical protein
LTPCARFFKEGVRGFPVFIVPPEFNSMRGYKGVFLKIGHLTALFFNTPPKHVLRGFLALFYPYSTLH